MNAMKIQTTATSKQCVEIILAILLANATLDGMEMEYFAVVGKYYTAFGYY